MDATSKAVLSGVLGLVTSVAWIGLAALALVIWALAGGTGPGASWPDILLACAVLAATGLVPLGLFAMTAAYVIKPQAR